MSEKIKTYKDLKIWQQGIDVVVLIYKITDKFPKHEQYGIVSQLRRAVVSIPSNIAEGFRRYHNKEYKQFLYIAMGSIAEVETQLIISGKLNYLNGESLPGVLDKLEELSRMTKGLINKL